LIALPPLLAPLSRLLQPIATGWVRDAWPPATQSRLTHCLLLALLLHVWLVLMLGNTPPGTALPGQGVGGALNVTLRGPAQGVPAVAATSPAPPAGLPGTATSPRAGGTVRAPSPQPVREPGAARQGDWAAMSAPTPDRDTEAPAAAQPAPGAMAPAPAPAERRLGGAPGSSAAPARIAPLERATAPPPVAARWPVPVSLPDTAAWTPPAAAPAAPAALEAPADPVWRQVAPMAASPAPAPALAPVQGLAAQAPVGLPELPAAPAGVPVAALPAGRPDAGPQVGHDVATAPSAPASAPRLNLDLVRPRGGELSRQGGVGVLPLLARPPELPDKLARDIDKAAKADCRKAYQGLGLLAVVPLAADALRGSKDSGCKW
jgi:hypothetical protein